MIIRYKPKLKQFSRDLRNQSTWSEVLFWQGIKGRQVRGYQFARQKPIGHFIADFYCGKLKLVVEIDGSSHVGKENYDARRQAFLEHLGLTVLRFDDGAVKRDPAGVVQVLEQWIIAREAELLPSVSAASLVTAAEGSMLGLGCSLGTG